MGELCEKHYRWLDNSGEYLANIHHKEFQQMSEAGLIKMCLNNQIVFKFVQRFSLVIVSLAVIDMIVGIIIPIGTLRKGR